MSSVLSAQEKVFATPELHSKILQNLTDEELDKVGGGKHIQAEWLRRLNKLKLTPKQLYTKCSYKMIVFRQRYWDSVDRHICIKSILRFNSNDEQEIKVFVKKLVQHAGVNREDIKICSAEFDKIDINEVKRLNQEEDIDEFCDDAVEILQNYLPFYD
jgi:hypothetical protein